MTKIDWKIMKWKRKAQRKREQRILGYIKKGALALTLMGSAVIFSGAAGCMGETLLAAYSGPVKLIETEYTVQENDTLWGIGEAYMAKNTGGDRYILEFIEGIKELNPELVESKGAVYPGQVLRINYFVKEEPQ